MITTYRYIGKLKMELDGFHNLPLSEQKKYIVQQYCASHHAFIERNKEQVTIGRIVKMNLDTANKTIHFSSGVEIDEETCINNLIMVNYAPGDPNIYATHGSIKSIFSFALLEYIQANRKKIRWSNPELVDPCIEFLEEIRKDFFVEDRLGIKPNYHLLPEDQIDGFPDEDIVEGLQGIDDDKKYDKKRKEILKNYLEKSLASITGKRQAYALGIDGKFFHETEYGPCYLDVLYYNIIDKQFAESKNVGYCHICSAETTLAKDVYLKQKFYGTQNPYYFDSTSPQMSSHAFSMCMDCYNEITVGTQYSATKLKTYLLNLDCLVLPEIGFANAAKSYQSIDPVCMHATGKLLCSREYSEKKKDLQILRNLLLSVSEFSLFFFFKPSPTSQEFIVNRFIKGISLASLIEKTDNLNAIYEEYKLVEIMHSNFALSFEHMRYLLLPSKESHPQLKPSDYQRINRDILSLLSTYLYSQVFDYSLMIKRFVEIYARRSNHQDKNHSSFDLDLSPFMMSLYLKHLHNYKQINTYKKLEEKPMTTTLQNEKLLQYFADNVAVYEGNRHAQGLFILGCYIAEIEREQYRGGIKRTAISKLNLRGIPLQKVHSVMAVMDDLRHVWKVYEDPITDAYYRECLADVTKGSLSPEEVVFHILSGRAYSRYVSIMESNRIKKEKAANQEVQND